MRSRRAEFLLLAVGLLAGLALAETGVRLLAAGRQEPRYAPVRTDRRERRPVNSQGYRDLERTRPRPHGVRRALCLGDSFTWGTGVLFEDTWPQRVERLLSRERGETWQAVNLGERGLSTVQELQKLASEGLTYEPEVVILAYVLNDSEDENAAEARRAADWVEAAARPRGPWDRSALFRWVRTRVSATIENRRRVAGFRSMYDERYPGWVSGRDALKKMGGLCRESGVPLVVAIFPLFANPLDAAYPFADVHAKVAQAAVAGGARVVDLLPEYSGMDWRTLVVDGANDEHPNEVAYRIAAQAIARAVDETVPRATPRPAAAQQP